MAATGEHISLTERRAMEAERDTIDRYVAAFLSERVGEVMPTRITGVAAFGLFVELIRKYQPPRPTACKRDGVAGAGRKRWDDKEPNYPRNRGQPLTIHRETPIIL